MGRESHRDDVHNSTRNNDDFPYLHAFQQFTDSFISESGFPGRCFIRIGRQEDLASDLPLDLHRDFHHVVLCHRVVEGGPRGKRDGGAVPKPVPEFLGHVRGEGREDAGQPAKLISSDATRGRGSVREFDQRCDGSVEGDSFDVFAHFPGRPVHLRGRA